MTLPEQSGSICTECGASLRSAREYHPFAFCVLKKAGLDPWREVRTITTQVGLGDPGARPPLVTDVASCWEADGDA